MYIFLGLIAVIGAVLGGYLLEKGNLAVIFQPAELLIIFGAALGSFFIASPAKVVKLVTRNIIGLFKNQGRAKEDYLNLLGLLNTLFLKIRKDGLISVEGDIESPGTSPIFKKFEGVLKNSKTIDFICDNLKVIISTNMPTHEMETLMEVDIEAHQREAMIPSTSVNRVADSLPGFGIVAAVLGVVLTMNKIDQPPDVLGHSIGAALVGTFLGVLLCYGFVGPMATNLEHQVREDEAFYTVIKVAMVAFVGGAAPQLAVEFGRRAIPSKERPTFNELEDFIRR